MRNTKYGRPGLLRKHELAERLYVSARTVEKMVNDGTIPAIHHPLGKGHGRKVFFDWPSVAKALNIPV